MSQHINIEDYLEPTDPPLPLPQISTFDGNNTINSTVTLGETMITQGYRIPLKIKQGATTKTTDIYIGSSPLTQGQTITKSQSNVDLELFSGDNIIDTTLVNKPQVDLTYRSSVLGVGERTTNLLEITTESQTIGGVTFTVDRQAGTVTANGTATSTAIFRVIFNTLPAGNYYFSGCPMGGSNTTYDVFMYDNTAGARARKWNGTAASGYDYDGSDQEFKVIEGNQYAYSFRIYEGYVCNNLVLTPTVRVPGYQIPISVTNGQQSTPYNFYIGSAPLTEGQSISKTSTGTEIALYQGENTISTTLGNKPEMKIDYLSTVVGVGERTKNLFDVSSFVDVDQNNVVMALNDDNATILVYTTGTPTAQTTASVDFTVAETGNYCMSGIPSTAPNDSIYIYCWDNDNNKRARAWDKTSASKVVTASDPTSEIYLENGVRYSISVRVQTTYGRHEESVVVSPMIRKPNTTPDFIPYGYQIPIDIKQGDEVVDHKDIYIGTQPLEEGASVSKVSVGEDIVLASGNNYIDTDLFNKPEMYIK